MYKKIKNDIIEYMKAKNLEAVKLLRYLDAIIQNEAIRGKELNDELVISCCKSTLRKINEEIDNSIKFNRPDIQSKKIFEKELIERYIPANVIDDSALDSFIDSLLLETTNQGKIMKKIKENFGKDIDMSKVKTIVKSKLDKK